MHTRGVVYKSLLLALIAGAWPADPGHAQAAVDVTVRSRLMTAAVSPSGGISGLFLTDPGKPWLLYRDSKSEEPRRIAFGEFRRSYEYGAPAGLVFADPRLYVYDASTRKVWSHLVHSEAKAEDEFITRLSKHPSHIAVSPHGLVAVIQDQEVFFLQKEKEPIRYPRSRFPQPIDLAFSSWNTLHVLDAVRNTLVSITFRRQADGQIVFEHEASLPVPEDGVQRKWRGMSIYEGVAYLVDETAVYAYLESDKRLVPVAMRADDRNPIQGLALTYDRLYALHADHIASYRRAQPVDLALEGGPVESQRALLALYRYLQRAGLLLTRTVRARSEQTRVNDFLFANGVLLVPSARTTRASTPQPPSTEETNFMELFCSMNAQVCREGEREQPRSLKMIVRKGSEVRIPLVQVLSRLGREHVELDGLPLAEHLAWRVPTTDLRKQAETLLLKLNPGWTQEDVLQRKNGAAILPVEHWTVIVAVPASDFRNRSSALWSLAHGYAGASLYGREGFTAQSGSLPLAQPPPAAISTDCQTLKQADRKSVV